MPRDSRREDVLVGAEKVFAEFGFDRATMRMIAEEAGVRLPLVVYHFETKLKLYRSVFEAHQHLNEHRRTLLESVNLDADDAVENVIDAFLSIVHAAEGDVRRQRYLRLVLREAGDPAAVERGIIADLFDPMAREFIRALEYVLPDKPAGFHRWAYLFSVGSLTLTSSDARERDLADGAPHELTRIELLKRYLVAAFRHG